MMKEVKREDFSLDDEEEDRRNLIPENDTVKPTSNSNPFSAFHIDVITTSSPHYGVVLSSTFKASSLTKRVGTSRAIGSNSTLNNDNSENKTSGYLNLSEMPVEKSVFEELKARIYQGILLNKEIQEVLLSTSKSGNVSELGIENGDLLSGGIGMCGNVDQKLSDRRTIEWNPRSGKYLFAICTSGQMSNHLICLEKHMFLAVVLGRVLVIPSHKVDYEFHRVLDIKHITKCVGRNVVVMFEEFSKMKKKNLSIDKFICYFSQPHNCYVDEEHVKKLKGLGL